MLLLNRGHRGGMAGRRVAPWRRRRGEGDVWKVRGGWWVHHIHGGSIDQLLSTSLCLWLICLRPLVHRQHETHPGKFTGSLTAVGAALVQALRPHAHVSSTKLLISGDFQRSGRDYDRLEAGDAE